MNIFEKFFLDVAQYACVIQPDEDVTDLSKILDHLGKSTFSSQSQDFIFQDQNAHTFDSLTAEPIVIERM